MRSRILPIVLTGALAACFATALRAAGEADSAKDPVLAAVRERDDLLQAAHGRGDMATYRAGLSKHYAYVDIGGERVTADMLERRRAGDQRRVVSSETSEDEALRLSETTVLLRGLERSVSTYYGGLPRHGASRWTALWVKEEDGVWRLVAETATPVREHTGLTFVDAPQPRELLAARAGVWELATSPPLTLRLALAPDDRGLVGTLDGQSISWTFRPASATHFLALERPFELRYGADGDTMDLVSWGTATRARRLP